MRQGEVCVDRVFGVGEAVARLGGGGAAPGKIGGEGNIFYGAAPDL